MPLRRRGEGFVLLEVLVATAILGTGIVFALGAFRSGLQLQGVAERRLRAIGMLEETLAMTEIDPLLEPGGRSGSAGSGGNEFEWRVDIREIEGPPVSAGRLLLIEGQVSYRDRPRPRTVSASRYIWQTESSE